jgi:hypothetical protein
LIVPAVGEVFLLIFETATLWMRSKLSGFAKFDCAVSDSELLDTDEVHGSYKPDSGNKSFFN